MTTRKPDNSDKGVHETRTITVKPPNAKNEGLFAAQVMTTEALRQERLDGALKSGSISPDSMLGLASKISKLQSTKHETSDLKKLILDHSDMIRHACTEFENIPAGFIETEGNSHRTSLAARTPSQLTEPVLTEINILENAVIDPINVEDTAYLLDVLRITAAFLKQKEEAA